jgi:isochorismate hydrolase
MTLDYKVVFVTDATCTFNEKMHGSSVETIRLAFGMVCTTDELMKELGLNDNSGEGTRDNPATRP